MTNAPRDENRVPSLLGVDSLLYVTPTTVAVDPTTHEMLVKASISSDDSVYATNQFDDYTTTNVTYVGQETNDGTWKIIKIDETGNFPVYTYASITNNPTLTTYTLAWTDRVTAVYNIYSTAF